MELTEWKSNSFKTKAVDSLLVSLSSILRMGPGPPGRIAKFW